MIQMPYEEVKSKIAEKSGLSDSEIESKINAKLEHLSGLISKEGAAHIIANELGIKLFEQISGKLQVKNILAGMRDVEVLGRVTNVFEVREFMRDGATNYVGSFIIGDETGSIRIVCWGEKAKAVNEIKEGDIAKITGAYARENNGRKELHANDRSTIALNPPGESVGAVRNEGFSEAERKKINELTGDEQNAELLGTIVQTFDPRFFEVCPQCGKRASPKDGGFSCIQHGAVTPTYSYVFNVSLDDGTGIIRCAFFRNQADRLAGKTQDQMLTYRQAPESFEEVKNELLGNIIKVSGKPRKNEMFDRLEFAVQRVDPEPDPSEEIQKLDGGQK